MIQSDQNPTSSFDAISIEEGLKSSLISHAQDALHHNESLKHLQEQKQITEDRIRIYSKFEDSNVFVREGADSGSDEGEAKKSKFKLKQHKQGQEKTYGKEEI